MFNMKVISYFKVCIIAAFMLVFSSWVNGQSAFKTIPFGEKSNWSGAIYVGLNSFHSKGIPQSRNEINYLYSHPGKEISGNQESGTAGLCYEAHVNYGLLPGSRLGFLVQAYRDDDEFFNRSDQGANASQIMVDSMQAVVISNMQSYVNLGFEWNQFLYTSPSTRHAFTANLAAGISLNRTPDRTEFDYYDEDHFVAYDTIGTNVWRLVSTDFKNGYFLHPSLTYQLKLGRKNFFHVNVGPVFQWHSTAGQLKILGENSSGETDRVNYRLSAIQIKIGYGF